MSDKKSPSELDVFLTFIWLLAGLAPMGILLAVGSRDAGHPSWMRPECVFPLCITLNLFGGFGCARMIKNWGKRLFLSLALAAFFFLLSAGVALFQACSHMNL